MKITDIASNPQIILELYQTEPKLDGIDVMQIVYDRDGPTIVVRFDLPVYPTTPPQKWTAKGFNRVQMQISFIGVHRIEHRGWGISNTAQMTFEVDDVGKNVVRICGETTDLKAAFDHLHIDRVSAYKNIG